MKSWKQIQQQLSQETGIPLKQVQQITDQYWLFIRSKLRNPDDMIYRVIGIGAFRVNQQRLFKQIKKHLLHLYRLRFNLKPAQPSLDADIRKLLNQLWKLKNKFGWGLAYAKGKSAKQEVLEEIEKKNNVRNENM